MAKSTWVFLLGTKATVCLTEKDLTRLTYLMTWLNDTLAYDGDALSHRFKALCGAGVSQWGWSDFRPMYGF